FSSILNRFYCISGKSQLLFALVFTTRYLDLFTSFISLYNTSMKLIYIACSYATVYLIYMKFKATYDGNHDTFRVEFLVVPVGGLSFLVNHDFSSLEILWTFSIYLESVAILPQLFMISKTGEAETITTHYLFFLGLYRALYLINWIWRYYFEEFFDLIAVVAGVVQTILYCDFFYLYVTKGKRHTITHIVTVFLNLSNFKMSGLQLPKFPGQHSCTEKHCITTYNVASFLKLTALGCIGLQLPSFPVAADGAGNYTPAHLQGTMMEQGNLDPYSMFPDTLYGSL
uniref:ER lumen protein-retaining receptor n=1 Tax=Laticauda laticaudata TaxID=8630 RepID=A0A8C5S2H7_LATLA